MKKITLLLSCMLFAAVSGYSQFFFPVEVEMPADWIPETVIMPPSPLKYQVLFVGETDKVQTTSTYGNNAGEALAKQWHDFIGFTPANATDIENQGEEFMGWITVNHEMTIANDSIGDGGGMTVFAVKRDPVTDTLVILDQNLPDGRTGKFFNVDFANTVGETGMNCGGITSRFDGRIWTAEEWWRGDNGDLVPWMRDTSDFTISTDIPGDFAGASIKAYQNFNWMVEIDPREAKAIRKQYNWGRQPFEGGTVLEDNKTVYFGSDATPGIFTKFIADVPGDFTKGKLFAYKHDATGPYGPWVEMPSMDLDTMLNFTEVALAKGATMFNRLEWVRASSDGKLYMAETGRDNLGSRFKNGAAIGGTLDYHWVEPVKARHPHLAEKTDDQVIDFVMAGFFNDYYGRVLQYDPATGLVTTYLEGGPFFEESPSIGSYPENHLSNPDGLNIMRVNGQDYMVICEDLNGSSYGRVPAGVSNRTCELWLLDMKIANPTVEDLVRISAVPKGAEVTGAQNTPDGKTLLANSQHPSTDNPFPYNNSLTFAITGWDQAVTAINNQEEFNLNSLKVWPSPVAQTLRFDRAIDAAIYDINGKRMKVFRNTTFVDVQDLKPGLYLLHTGKHGVHKFVVQQ